jgi:hypothetical protein
MKLKINISRSVISTKQLKKIIERKKDLLFLLFLEEGISKKVLSQD